MDISAFSLLKIEDTTIFKPFDCGDVDLNSFLFEKSKNYSNELLAKTYLLENKIDTIAFFCISNDSLKVETENFISKSAIKKFLSITVSHPKRHLQNFPAIKIGRLGVNKDFHGSGIGKVLVNYIIDYSIEQNKQCACKFLIVDAYDKSVGFYENIGFSYLSIKDRNSDTRQMYLDLTPLINALIPKQIGMA